MNELLDRVQAALGDSFRVESEMPAGGMSRVFLALESSLNRQVVVKVLPPDLASEVSAARFRREAEYLARLQHPHILPILTSGWRGDVLYYVMPYVQGESVRHRLQREGAFPVDDAIRILSETADALSYAHAAGVLHRDIKPENILLEGRHAVLADFGVARAFEQSVEGGGPGRLTATGVSVGTPGYMSPEQVAGDTVDARADLYALAVVGYEMLTGKPPFVGPSAQAILTAHLTTPPLPLDEVRPEVPASVSRAIARALSKAPEDRFSNASEFRDALSAGDAAAARGRGQRAGPFPMSALRARYPAIAAAAVGAVVLGVVVAIGSRGVDEALVERIRTAADSGWVDEAARLLDSAGVGPDHRGVRDKLAPFTGRLAVSVAPADAAVEVTRVEPIQSFGTRTPRSIPAGTNVALLQGEYLLRARAPGGGHDDGESLVTVAAESSSVADLELWPSDANAPNRVRVPGGASPAGGSVQSFSIGRYEVTNEEYLAFVSAGGYRDRSLWPDGVRVGTARTWDASMKLLVDGTGLPGPRGWEGGRYPTGRARHPVVGVTWYEAAAYARWAGGRLPSAAEWWRASLGGEVRPYPWGSAGASAHLRANLEGVGTTPVGSYPLGVSPFGARDMAGNAREWLADPANGGSRRLTAGGSWQEPAYTASLEWMERSAPDYTSGALGFRVLWPGVPR